MTPALASRARGCLLGGAVGDALGAPVEFETRDAIRKRFGPGGITDFAPAYGRVGAITDDTQMTLFTAEGILRAVVRQESKGICAPVSVVSNAYLRWLLTQGEKAPPQTPTDGWLFGVKALHARRAPGNTCLTALRALEHATIEKADNDSKGAGGIMRIAPWAVVYAASGPPDFSGLFRDAMHSAWLTHGHPSGYLAAGAFAVVLGAVLMGRGLREGVKRAAECLREIDDDSSEVSQAMFLAMELTGARAAPAAAIPELGEGWVAEEALAIALYCAATAPSLEDGIIMAVNITGDSDTTGSLAGQLLGAQYGIEALPKRWLSRLELRAEIEELAADLLACASWDLDGPDGDKIRARYPGH